MARHQYVLPDTMLMQDNEKEVIIVDEIHQRIDTLKQRRRNDKINLILSSAAKGDLETMTTALKVQIENLESMLMLFYQVAGSYLNIDLVTE
jgi:hypothetical protein